MEEKNGLAMRSDFRLPVAGHTRAFCDKPVAGGLDIVDFKAKCGGCRLPRSQSWRASNNSIFVFGKVMKIVDTPCSGCGAASGAAAPKVSR